MAAFTKRFELHLTAIVHGLVPGRAAARQIFIAVLLAYFGESVFAQTAGRITGQILDQSQASIPGATVTAENTATGARREIASDRQGRYVFDDLPIGMYKVTVSAKGFQSQMRSELELNVASTFVVDFTLPTGQVSEAVEVKAKAEVIDPNAANGQLMGNKSVVDLPINGRDYARFTLLTPGAVAVYNYIADTTFNGMSSVSNQFSIDGIDASRVDEPYMANGFERGARLLTGSLDTVEEFRVQTSNFNAEYGRAAGHRHSRRHQERRESAARHRFSIFCATTFSMRAISSTPFRTICPNSATTISAAT